MRIGVLATISLAFVIGLPLAASAGLATDTDSDGIPDVNDSCTLIQNAAPSDCDTDTDGYGNQCDGDFNQDTTVNATDFSSIFVPDFTATVDGGTGTDMNCDTTVNATDFTSFFIPQFSLTEPGPSGLGCAGTSPCP